MKHEAWEFSGAGGVRLYAQSWLPDASPRALVALVHGISEHSGRYRAVVDRLVPSGFAFCGFDHRGHGRSPGRRGHIDSWSQYRDDLRAFLAAVSHRMPGAPVFLYAHSMGALIALDYVIAWPDGLRGLVASGVPLQPVGVAKPHLVAVARVLSRILPSFSISLGIGAGGISRDPAVVDAYRNDPLVSTRVSMRWGTEILATIEHVRAHASEIRIPILIIHGGADPINAANGSLELLDSVSSTDKQLAIYPGGKHEPHNDLDRDSVMGDVERWLTERSTPAGS